jgi:RNA polymerase sigma-70 factor (ECF subfamily)
MAARRTPPAAFPRSAPTPDESVEAARRGERGAQGEILRRHYPALHALAFRLTGNPEDAEDLAQEGFVRAFRSLGHFRGTGSLEGWLKRIVVHLAQDRFRARRRGEVTCLPEGLAGGREPHQTLERRELALALSRALEQLGAPLRVALLLRTREGLEYEEIATLTGVTAETARTRVMKARRDLTRRLAPYLAEARGPRDVPGRTA